MPPSSSTQPDGDRYALPPLFEHAARRTRRHLADLRRLAGLLDEPERFLGREAAADGEQPVATYRLRESGRRLALRHRSRDLGVLDEIFGRGYYELPDQVADDLGGLTRPLRAVDIGANIGLFGIYLLERFPDAHITAFEPDAANAEVHRRAIRENGLDDRWRLVPACASNEDGWVSFLGDDFSGCCIADADAEADGADRVRSVDVLGLLGEADLLKIDAEGGEWTILGDARLADAAVRAIVLEYHPYLCPGDDPRRLAESLLGDAGYETSELFHRPDGVGMLWAWRA